MSDGEEQKRQEEYERLAGVIKPLEGFLRAHPQLSYIEFEYYTVHDLTLFTSEPDFDFASLQANCQKIIAALPAIKRIFGKPIINLKDIDDVLPVETVRVISQDTLTHLASHTQNVADLTSRGVKPRRLLTKIYEDDYGIYENVIFCNFIDEILRYVRQNMRSLRDLVYAGEVMDFNLLERVNHLNYFLSIGELHTGYIRDFDKYYSLAKSLYKELQLILSALTSRLKKPVYLNNRIRNKKLALRKTNIFLMQKDYHQVYVLYKAMLAKKPPETGEKKELDLKALQADYFFFVQMLAIFAIGHFNFETDPNQKMDLASLDVLFHFKGWGVRLQNEGGQALLLTVTAQKAYKILLVPSLDGEPRDSAALQKAYGAEEAFICSPFEENYLTSPDLFISIENIESFRRIQQLLLTGMVYADTEKKECPFCQGKLSFDPKAGSYVCESCRTEIKEETCPETGQAYFVTGIKDLKRIRLRPEDYAQSDQWLYQRKAESALFFRNITRLDGTGQPLCPYCGKDHEEKESPLFKAD
jgi:uncharacterized Zn finger protein (UPF0148 family)